MAASSAGFRHRFGPGYDLIVVNTERHFIVEAPQRLAPASAERCRKLVPRADAELLIRTCQVGFHGAAREE